MNIRVTESLIRLNIEFKSQVLIAGRYIDFSLDKDILLEVDGVFHY
jgi:very-short-patch-repair endonuclease